MFPQNNENLLYEACCTQNVELVQRLINTCVCVTCYKDGDGWTALLRGTVSNITALVEILLKAGANPNDVNKWGDTPLRWAIKYDNVDMIRVLIKYRANLKLNLVSPALHTAAEMGSIAAMKYLVSIGIKINTRDWKLDTPLKVAKYSKKNEAAQYLKSIGAKD